MAIRFEFFLAVALIQWVFVGGVSSSAWAWGKKGHESIEIAAIELLPPSALKTLLFNNSNTVRRFSMVPDMVWKHGPSSNPEEAHTHFFEVDFYSNEGDIKLIPKSFQTMLQNWSNENLHKGGTAPWRLQQLAVLLVRSFQESQINPLKILSIAATMGHYMADLGQPLHSCKDYDGKLIGVPKLHSFYETKSVEGIPEGQLLNAIARTGQQMLSKVPEKVHPLDAAFATANAAFLRSDELLKMAKSMGLTPELAKAYEPMIIQTMSVSVAMLAKIWHQAWILGGSPNFSSENLGDVPNPQWIPLDYYK